MAQVIVRPNGVGAVDDVTHVGGSTFWETTDDVTHDGDTTYSLCESTSNYGMATFSAHGLTEGDVIDSIEIFTTVKSEMAGGAVVYGLSNDALNNWGVAFQTSVPDTYTEYSVLFTENPATSSPYTIAELDVAQFAFAIGSIPIRMTQIYAKINYTPAPSTTNAILLAGN